MFDYQHTAFVIAALLLFWDFKLTMFVITPIYLVGEYFFLAGLKNIPGNENLNIAVRLMRDSAIVAFIIVANYVQQLQICRLICSRYTLKTQQEQLNNIFMSQPDGILVYNIED
jgi:hypothetical protein